VDSNGDGSGDACQPVLSFTAVRQDGGSALEVRAVARDPQGEPLSGQVQLFSTTAATIVLNDAVLTDLCGAGFLPDAIPGEGIAYVNGSVGSPILLDLDSNLGCADGFPDYEFAPGSCAAPSEEFQTFLNLPAGSSALCVRRIADHDRILEFTILEIADGWLRLTSGTPVVAQALSFSGWPPRNEPLSGLEEGTTYRLRFDISDGNTIPVSAEQEFVYHGETTLLVNNPPASRVATVAPAECESAGGALVHLDGSSSEDPDSTPGTQDAIVRFEWVLDATTPSESTLGTGEQLDATIPLGTHTVTLRVTDVWDESDAMTIPVSVVDTTPPMLSCAAPVTLECASPAGAVATVVASASDACGAVTVWNDHNHGGADGSGVYLFGDTPVEFTATDASGNSVACSTNVAVRDTVAPVVTLSGSPLMLWPPNHRLVPIQISAQVTDLCSAAPAALLVSALSSEPDDAAGDGDGNTTGDVRDTNPGTPDSEVLVRAERAASGTGRTYELRYRSTDAAGNLGEGVLRIRVPRTDPAGIDPLRLLLDGGAASGGQVISWDSVPGATGYDMIRGDLSQITRQPDLISLGVVAVLARGIPGSNLLEPSEDLAVPPVGKAFFYLGQYRLSDGSTSGYGTESAALPREPASCIAGCPTAAPAGSGVVLTLDEPESSRSAR
jgi:hypothetical protein